MVVPLDSYRRDEPFRRAAARPNRDADVRSDERVFGACDLCGSAADWASPIEALPVILATPARFTSALANMDPGQWSRTRTRRRVTAARSRARRRALSRHREPAPAHLRTGATEITPAHDERNFAVSPESPPIVRAALSAASADLARVVNEAAPDDWTLTARDRGRTVSAETLLREALDDARDHLHDLQQAVRTASP